MIEFDALIYELNTCGVFTAKTTVCKTPPQAACSFLHQKFISCSNVLAFMLASGPHLGPSSRAFSVWDNR